MDYTFLNIRMPKAMKNKLKQLAKKEDLDVSKLVRREMGRYLLRKSR